MTLNLQIDVPDTLVRKAKRAGLLKQDAFAQMLESELSRRQAGAELAAILEKVRAVPGDPMSLEEIQVEVDAVRAERRRQRESRS